MPQPTPTGPPVLQPGGIFSQPNAAVNTADKLLPQIISELIAAVDSVTAAINAKPSAA